eukprot:4526938-Amphidinium_carterae.1
MLLQVKYLHHRHLKDDLTICRHRPMFGQLFENMLEDSKGQGAGKERSNKVKSSPDRADGTSYSRSGRSDRNAQMVRGSGSTRTSGQGGDGGDDDDDKDGA